MNVIEINKLLQGRPPEAVYSKIANAAVQGEQHACFSFSEISRDNIEYLKLQGYEAGQYRSNEDEGYKISGWSFGKGGL